MRLCERLTLSERKKLDEDIQACIHLAKKKFVDQFEVSPVVHRDFIVQIVSNISGAHILQDWNEYKNHIQRAVLGLLCLFAENKIAFLFYSSGGEQFRSGSFGIVKSTDVWLCLADLLDACAQIYRRRGNGMRLSANHLYRLYHCIETMWDKVDTKSRFIEEAIIEQFYAQEEEY